MAFKRATSYRRPTARTAKRRTLPSRRYAATTIQKFQRQKKVNSTLYRLNRRVASMPKVETKHYCVSLIDRGDIRGNGLLQAILFSNRYGYYITNLFDHVTIGQGVQSNQRVGESITVKNCYMKCLLQNNPSTPNFGTQGVEFPFQVKVMLFKDRTDPNTNNPTAIKVKPDMTYTSIDGTAQNDWYRYNTARYQIATLKTFHMKPNPIVLAGSQVTPAQPGDQVLSGLVNPTQASGHDKSYRSFNLKIPCVKSMKFMRGVDKPNQRGYSLGIWIVNGNGELIPSDVIRARFSAQLIMDYTDA